MNKIDSAHGDLLLVLDANREKAVSTARSLAGNGRLVLTGCDAVLASLVLSRMPLTTLVTDIGISGPFSFEGLELIADVRRLAPGCTIVVTGETLSAPLATEAVRRGATLCIRKPLDAAVLRDGCGLTGDCGSDDGAILHIPTIDELIASDQLAPAFQPIVDLTDPTRPGHGFESLARYREAALPFCDPQFLFHYAKLRGRTADLELACLRRTLREARTLARDGRIFINVNPQVFSDGERLTRTLVEESSDNGVPLEQLVLEITEQEKLDSSPSTVGTIEQLRALGVQFALDDVGMSYSHLDLIDRIKPSYLKISQEFGTGFEQDASRKKIIRNILSLAHDFDCDVVLEGVETAATSGAAAEIGAKYAQGFYYAKPRPAEELTA